MTPSLYPTAGAPATIDRTAIRAAHQIECAGALQVGLATVNGEELHDREYPTRRFIVDGLIQQGDLVLLAGRPKSGKSWLLLQLAQAVDAGTPFLRRATTKTRVLYLALEDGERRIHERLNIRKWRPQSATFAFGMMPLAKGDGLAQIEAAIPGHGLVMIDTLRAACGPGVDENDNAAMGAIVQSLADLSHRSGAAIFASHHTRKGDAEDVFDLIRGAGAIRGAYDVGVVIQRKPREAEAVLHVESRDVDADDMTIKFDGATGWSYEGDGCAIEEIRAGREVVKALRELGNLQTTEAIAAHRGRDRSTVLKQLQSLEQKGIVVREDDPDARGKKPCDLWSLKN
jgi:RecA-family ATPase